MLWSAYKEVSELTGALASFVLMVCLSPIFFLLAVLYVCNHPYRRESTRQQIPGGNLVV
jgi:hypothetical protein